MLHIYFIQTTQLSICRDNSQDPEGSRRWGPWRWVYPNHRIKRIPSQENRNEIVRSQISTAGITAQHLDEGTSDYRHLHQKEARYSRSSNKSRGLRILTVGQSVPRCNDEQHRQHWRHRWYRRGRGCSGRHSPQKKESTSRMWEGAKSIRMSLYLERDGSGHNRRRTLGSQ